MKTMESSFLAERLARWLPLTPAEQTACSRLEGASRRLKRGSTLVPADYGPGDAYVVRRGWLYSSVLLDNGARQIVNFYFPGDVAGLFHLASSKTIESLTVVADAEVALVDRSCLREMFVSQPRLCSLLFFYAQGERVALGQRLATVGRMPARARVAALIAQVLTGLRSAGPVLDNSFHLALTQEEIGDATGLTAVHVNRMLRSLASLGLIERRGSMMTVLDERALKRMANWMEHEEIPKPDWLPDAA
jgi:CRP/FNR family transcriptional regulator, anaerobic regulatory protein